MILRHNVNFQDLFFIFAELFMYRRTYALSLFQGAFLWLQTIDMDAFDNNVVESYKMSKSIFCCNLSVEKYWSAGRFDTHQSKISSVVAWKRSM